MKKNILFSETSKIGMFNAEGNIETVAIVKTLDLLPHLTEEDIRKDEREEDETNS